jgi:hypothetical protein
LPPNNWLTRRIAGAAGILQEQRGEQVRAIVGRQLELFRQPHANQTASRRMAERLPFGEIEGVRHRRQHGRELD